MTLAFKCRDKFLARQTNGQIDTRSGIKRLAAIGVRPAWLQVAEGVQFANHFAGVGMITVEFLAKLLAVLFLLQVNAVVLEVVVKFIQRDTIR